MSTTSGDPVIAGVDGSAQGHRAVRLAAEQARGRHRALRLVHALGWPLNQTPITSRASGPLDGGPRFEAERLLAQAIADARQAAPEVPVSGEIADGQPANVLLARSSGAALIVLGSRGLGGFGSLLLGSVALQVSTHALCPVLVARGGDRDGPVVVGVDGSPLSTLATGFAFAEAAKRGAELIAVHAYRDPVSAGPGDMLPLVHDVDSLRSEEDRVLAEGIAGWREKYPDVAVARRLVRNRPAPALVEESTRAGLVVVGARGRGGFAGLVTGSVSHALLHHADCPVAIVRPGCETEPDGPRRAPVPGQVPEPGP